jgi:hypothetical protein
MSLGSDSLATARTGSGRKPALVAILIGGSHRLHQDAQEEASDVD